MWIPAPPRSLRPSFLLFAASAMRPASSMGSSSGRGVRAGTPLSQGLDLDHDRFEVGHLFERKSAADAPDAALLAGAASEGQVRLPVVGRLVDVDPASLEPISEAQGAGQVLRVDRAKQAVRRVVRKGERLLLVPELDDRGDRAEGLLLAHAHGWLDAVEDGRVVVEAGREALRALSPRAAPGALPDR